MAGNFDRFNKRRAQSKAAWASGMIDASEIEALAYDLRAAGEAAGERASLVVRKTAFDIEADGKAFAPFDTGYLRSSIGSEFDGDRLGAAIGPAASYGAHLEYGTSTMAPHAFMGPAFDRHSGEFVAAMEQLAGDVL